MIKIAICDDEVNVCQQLEEMFMVYAETTNIDISVDIYYSAKKLKEKINIEIMYDVIFMDIEMEELDGIEFGRELRDKMKDERTKIIYISWEDSYIQVLFDIRPFAFISKPLSQLKISKTLDTVYEIMSREEDYIRFQSSGKYFKVYFTDIMYVESEGRQIILHTKQGIESFYGKLEEVLVDLDPRYFWRIHKSFVINYSHVSKFEYSNVTLDGGKKLPISQKNRTHIRTLKKKYWGKNR